MIYRKAFAVGICIVKQWKERLGEQYMNTSQAEGIDQLQSWVNESKRIVFFGGAGVSTESGIPDFRSVDGLYHQTAPNAIHFMIFTVLLKAQAFRLVNVVVLSSRMLYYTKRD